MRLHNDYNLGIHRRSSEAKSVITLLRRRESCCRVYCLLYLALGHRDISKEAAAMADRPSAALAPSAAALLGDVGDVVAPLDELDPDEPDGLEEKLSCVAAESMCCTSVASTALLPGFVVPNAQMMFSGVRLLLSFCIGSRAHQYVIPSRPWGMISEVGFSPGS